MYTVYKITNTINSKYYIGVHKTDDPNDSYFGSGKAIKAAIAKYKKESFTKEILFITDSKEEAYLKEAELTEDYNTNKTYNMKLGGVGGFTKENSMKGHLARSKKGGLKAKELGKVWTVETAKSAGSKGGLGNKGIPKSEEHKQKLRDTWALKKQEMANGEPERS